jgi:hypothetical protein
MWLGHIRPNTKLRYNRGGFEQALTFRFFVLTESMQTNIAQVVPTETTPDWDAYRRLFPTVEQTIYLRTCSLGALSVRSHAAAKRFLVLYIQG